MIQRTALSYTLTFDMCTTRVEPLTRIWAGASKASRQARRAARPPLRKI
jgi:hypothetical protein